MWSICINPELFDIGGSESIIWSPPSSNGLVIGQLLASGSRKYHTFSPTPSYDMWKISNKLNYSGRDIPQIHLILGNFECKKSLIKNCWIFLKKLIDYSNLFITYLRNIWKDIHWKYAQILIQKNWKIFDFRKYAFFDHVPISSNFICSKIFWCWPSVD